MDYYSCPIEELHKEVERRGYAAWGTCDQISESLKKDEEVRNAEATTVKTEDLGLSILQEHNVTRTAEFGHTALASSLINESECEQGRQTVYNRADPLLEIVYWTMNTFFPTLQLFFESGLSCTIDGTRLPNACIGLDPKLRFRLTDCTHDEDGLLTKTTLPERFARSGTGLVIKEALVAKRTSIAVKPAKPPGSTRTAYNLPLSTIVQETHMVVGLRFGGMSKMAYVWAKAKMPSGSENKIWGDVRIAGLRDDVPAPLLGYFEQSIKPGYQVTVVHKKSIISDNAITDKAIPTAPEFSIKGGGRQML